MARGRMLDKEVSESNSFADLKDSNSQLLCVLLTPWWDDHGKMIGDEAWIKGNIVRKLPQFTLKEVSRCLKNIHNHLNVHWWTEENSQNKWLYWEKFDKFQTISDEKKGKDRLPSPKIPKNPLGKVGEGSPQDLSKDEVEDEGEVEMGKVGDFFSYYLLKTKKNFKLTRGVRSLIKRRIEEGYTLEQLKQAVDNFIQDDWVDRNKHLDIIYCIGRQKGKPDALEKWLNYKPKPQFIKP